MIYEPKLGTNFHDAVKELKAILVEEKSLYRQMKYKDIYVTVSVDSNTDDLATIYDLKKQMNIMAINLNNLLDPNKNGN